MYVLSSSSKFKEKIPSAKCPYIYIDHENMACLMQFSIKI